MSDRIRLGDDGTMDTVLVCRACGEEARYNYEPPDDLGEQSTDAQYEQAYEAFIAWAIADFDSEHECSESDEATE